MIDTTKLPYGGERIWMLRKLKRKPERIVVSLLPPNYRVRFEPYHLVKPIVGKKYDWRFIVGCEVTIVCYSHQCSLPLCEDLLLSNPTHLSAFFIDEALGYDITRLPTEDSVDLDQHRWVYELSFDSWLSTENRDWSEFIESNTESIYV